MTMFLTKMSESANVRILSLEKLALLLPAWWQISEARDADAARKRAPNGSFDDVGAKNAKDIVM